MGETDRMKVRLIVGVLVAMGLAVLLADDPSVYLNCPWRYVCWF